MKLDATISTIMTTNVRSVQPDEEIIKLKHIYERPDFHSHVPVIENGKLVGIVSLINFMHAIEGATLDDSEEAYHNNLVRDIMTSNPVTVTPETSIREVATILSGGNFHSIIIATDGVMNGIVTTTDILRELIK